MPDSCERELFHAQVRKAKVARLFGWLRRALQWSHAGQVSAGGGFLRGVLLCVGLSVWLQVLGAAAASSSVTLAWNPSPSGGVSGYRVHQGGRSGDYTNVTDVGNSTTITIPDLAAGSAYFFAITAYDADGRESGFSNEIVYTPAVVLLPAIASLQLRAAPAGGRILTLTGPAGRTYDLLASPDLQGWVVLGVVTVGAGGQLEFTDSDAVNYPARFYRARETQPAVQLGFTPARQMVLSVTGQNGRTYDVQTSSNLTDWAVTGAVTVGESGAANFVDVEAANYPARFYRTRERQP